MNDLSTACLIINLQQREKFFISSEQIQVNDVKRDVIHNFIFYTNDPKIDIFQKERGRGGIRRGERERKEDGDKSDREIERENLMKKMVNQNDCI